MIRLLASMLLIATGCDGNSTQSKELPDLANPGTTTGGGGGADMTTSGGGADLGTPIMPGDPGSGDVTLTITDTDEHAISPYIYGLNAGSTAPSFKLPFGRSGGDRWTAYNWETNASNAGYYGQGQSWEGENDNYLSSSATPGDAVWKAVKGAWDQNQAYLVTVPIQGYVSADESPPGDVKSSGANYLQTRFFQTWAKKPTALSMTPDTSDKAVYQDEFVSWLENTAKTNYPNGHAPLFYQLDNEPDFWAGTHANTQTTALTYAALMKESLDNAAAIKAHAADTKVFGPTMGGWYGQVALQGATDANNRNFIDFYLKSFADADAASGTRTLDVLDVHWYPEASSTSDSHGPHVDNDMTDAATVATRVQTPRSLWDPDYEEVSWITKDAASGPIDLLDRLQKSIDANYPGTRISITEYYYGGGDDISGAVAEADALGAFARKNLFAASLWSLTSGMDSYIHAAMQLYLTYFGDTSLAADSSNKDQATVWASRFSTDADKLTVVAINKTGGALKAKITLSYARPLGTATAWVLAAGSATPTSTTIPISSTNAFLYPMPPMSVSAIVLTK